MSTSLSATLMEFLTRLFGDEDARNEFLADGPGYLEKHGLDDLSCADFDDAMYSFFENAEFENNKDGHNLAGNFTNTVAHDGQSDHEAISEHLTKIVHEYGDTYVTNNDNDVVNDNSFQGQIFADGDVTFDNDITSASGDGAVAAGDDIDGDVVTGDGSFIGDDNQVGDGAFGAGSVSGGVNVEDGGAFANNGSTANGSQDDNSSRNEDSFNTDNSNNSDNSVAVDVDVDDSLNDNSSTDNSQDNDDNSETNLLSNNNVAGDDVDA